MTTGPFAVKSESLTGLPSTPFSAKSGACCPTSRALAPPASATLTSAAATTVRSSRNVRIGPPLVRRCGAVSGHKSGRPPSGSVESDQEYQAAHPLSMARRVAPRGADPAGSAKLPHELLRRSWRRTRRHDRPAAWAMCPGHIHRRLAGAASPRGRRGDRGGTWGGGGSTILLRLRCNTFLEFLHGFPERFR